MVKSEITPDNETEISNSDIHIILNNSLSNLINNICQYYEKDISNYIYNSVMFRVRKDLTLLDLEGKINGNEKYIKQLIKDSKIIKEN